jgi:hypothetical protein
MNKNRLLKLASLILLTAAILSGALQGGPAPALALDCPDSYQAGSRVCVLVSVVCDESGCCCEYAYNTGTGVCRNICE